jgi:hypothetical protein
MTDEEKKKLEEEKKKADEDAAKKVEVVSKEEMAVVLKKQREEFDAEKKKAIEDAASREKAKLYDTIEKHKTDLETLSKKVKEDEEKKSKEAAELEAKRKDELDAKARIAELEKSQDEMRERFSTVLDLENKKFTAELEKRDLALFREKLISEAKGEIIPELVSGKSKEELEQTAELAKERYKTILENSKKQTIDELIKSGKIPGPDGKDKKPQDTDRPAGSPDLREIFAKAPEDFKKYADSYLDEYRKSSS